jgi:holliday junction DNA helicase RuvA
MFNHLRGRLAHRSPARVVLDIAGVGYELTVPLSTYEKLPTTGEATLLVHMQVREDDVRLFGFLTEGEREFFRLLLTVNGIGPVMALAALSGGDIESLKQSVVNEDLTALTRIKGIGPRTAKRMIVELKPALVRQGVEAGAIVGEARRVVNDAVAALISLGYSAGKAEKSITAAAKKLGPDAVVEDLVRQGLKEN